MDIVLDYCMKISFKFYIYTCFVARPTTPNDLCLTLNNNSANSVTFFLFIYS